MRLTKQFLELIKSAGSTANTGNNRSVDIIPTGHDILAENLKDELESLEKKITNESDRDEIKSLIEVLQAEIRSFRTEVLTDHSLRELMTSKKISILGKIIKINDIFYEKANIKTPQHFTDLNFSGVDSLKDKDIQYQFCLSDTDPSYLILREKNSQKLKSSSDSIFLIGITNCPVKEPFSDLTISRRTASKSSDEDFEVFDTIQEIKRIYETNFNFGILQVTAKDDLDETESTIINDYSLAELITTHCESNSDTTSLELMVVAESKNLNRPQSIDDIFDKIPFDKIKAMGISDISLNIFSCNTTEILPQIRAQIENAALVNEIKIEAHTYNGYVQNNSSFCYISNSQKESLTKKLQQRKKDGEENPIIDLSSEHLEHLRDEDK